MAIDYERMNKRFPVQKRALTRAMKTGDMAKVVRTTAETIQEWNEIGCWPDDWARWDRALSDVWWAHRKRYLDGETDVGPRGVDVDTIASYLATAGDVDTAVTRMGF